MLATCNPCLQEQPNANRQPPGPPTPSISPDPPRSVYGMLGSGAPAEPDRTGLAEPAQPDGANLAEPATPSIPTARLWTLPPKLCPTPIGLRTEIRDPRSEIRCVEDESSSVSGLQSPISALRQTSLTARVSRRRLYRTVRRGDCRRAAARGVRPVCPEP